MRSKQERRKSHSEKKLCFNYSGTQHHATACKSKRTFQMCQRKHSMPICDKSGNKMLTTENPVIHPVAVKGKQFNMRCPTWHQCGKLLRISCIIKQIQDEIDSERDKNHWYDDDFNKEKTRSLWFRDIGSVRKIHTKLASVKGWEKYTSITAKSKI